MLGVQDPLRKTYSRIDDLFRQCLVSGGEEITPEMIEKYPGIEEQRANHDKAVSLFHAATERANTVTQGHRVRVEEGDGGGNREGRRAGAHGADERGVEPDAAEAHQVRLSVR